MAVQQFTNTFCLHDFGSCPHEPGRRKGMRFNQSPEAKRVQAIREDLTQREKEILLLIVKGYSNQQIADELHISLPTVKTHRSNILFKCDVKNTASLVRLVMENNLLH